MLGATKKPPIYSRYLGVQFGKHVRITGKPDFGSDPFLAWFGDRVTIAEGVMFLTHDSGSCIFRNEHPGLNNYGEIRVGNNVF